MWRLPISWLAVAALSGCGGQQQPGHPTEPELAVEALKKETGHSWTVRYHPDLGTPAFLEGGTSPLALTLVDAERVSRSFVLGHRGLFRIAPDDTLSTLSAASDELSMHHVRLAQHRGRVPVWGGELVLHYDPQGRLVRINGRYLPLGPVELVPAHTGLDARAVALSTARTSRPELPESAFGVAQPSLWVYPLSAEEGRLAWRIELEVHDLARSMALAIFVDAVSAQVLHQVDNLASLEATGAGVFGQRQSLTVTERAGAFWLEDPTRGSPPLKTYSAAGRQRLPGAEVKSHQLDHWDEGGEGTGSAVDAHAFVAAVYDYFARVHGRMGWDGHGRGIRTTVHFGRQYGRAFFNGKQLVFGDGDGQHLASLAGALDVVAHEFTHGVTYHTAKLGMEGQSGALNEAISDIFGCLVEQRARDRSDWQLGETVYHPGGRAQPLRDLAMPHRTMNPATMQEYVDTVDDNGGIHLNSTIVSHAAYLMSEGAVRGVRGLGADKVERIWYRALTRYLTSQATFADAADATVAAASDLGGGQETAVRAAWSAVGVPQERAH